MNGTGRHSLRLGAGAANAGVTVFVGAALSCWPVLGARGRETTPLPVAIGDSIAQGVALVDGFQNDGVRGIGPAAVLGNIVGLHANALRGRATIISTGLSNSQLGNLQADLRVVQGQVDAAREKGASDILLLGVGAVRFPGVNDALARVALANGLSFSGPLNSLGPDGVHPDTAGYRFLGQRFMPNGPSSPVASRRTPQPQPSMWRAVDPSGVCTPEFRATLLADAAFRRSRDAGRAR